MAAQIKIKGIKEPFIIDNLRGRQVKVLRFGDVQGIGKVEPSCDLNIGDMWSGTVGQIEWVTLDPVKAEKPPEPEQSPEERKKGLRAIKRVGEELYKSGVLKRKP